MHSQVVVDGRKMCSKCQVWQSLDQFHLAPQLTTGLSSNCRSCKGVSRRAWRKANPRRDWAHQIKQYGATPEWYEMVLEEQEGVCAICFDPPTVRPLSVDHDHKTGKARGLLCKRCNLGLGLFLDSQSRLEAAADYLCQQGQ